jgi:hypothetical protein
VVNPYSKRAVRAILHRKGDGTVIHEVRCADCDGLILPEVVYDVPWWSRRLLRAHRAHTNGCEPEPRP